MSDAWIEEQIPLVTMSILGGIEKARQRGAAVEMPDSLYFVIDAGRIKVEFEVPLVRNAGESGNGKAVTFSMSPLYAVRGYSSE